MTVLSIGVLAYLVEYLRSQTNGSKVDVVCPLDECRKHQKVNKIIQVIVFMAEKYK